MTELLYLKDAYLKECEATVVENIAAKKGFVFDRTVFYPGGGGLPCDEGTMTVRGDDYVVSSVRREDGKVVHFAERPELPAGEKVALRIDWERRYAIMRMHTAAHILGAAAFGAGALITGNQVGGKESRMDFSFEEFDRPAFDAAVAKANENLAKGIDVKTYFLPREEAMRIPNIVKLANALPPAADVLRIVEIPGADIQADGGPHVANTRECGRIILEKLENKGAKNKRIYFTLETQ